MEQKKWMDFLVLLKRMGNLINEVHDISRQLAEAVDRDDRVSVEMLVAMRREPIEKLMTTDQSLREALAAVEEPEEGRRLAALLNGEPAQNPEEQMLAEQVASNDRRLKQVVSLDEVLNRKLTREKSVYQ